MSTKASENATEQASKPRAGKGGVVPPEDKQFGKPNGNPRHNGAWKKEDTARYKLEQMLKLSEAELREIRRDKSAPYFERRIARSLLTEGRFETTAQMMNQVYGMPKQEIKGDIEMPTPLVDLTKRKHNHGKDDSAQ